MNQKALLSVIALAAIVGIAYLALYGPTGLVVLPPAGNGNGSTTEPVAPPAAGDDTGGGTTPTAPVYSVGSYEAAVSAAAADSALAAAWGEKTTWCGEAYRGVEGAVAQVADLDLKAGTVKYQNSAESERWYNVLRNLETSVNADASLVSALESGSNAAVAEYESLLRGKDSKFGELAVSSACSGCGSVYAVHLFCQPIRKLGVAATALPQNAIAFVDKETGKVYS